MASVDSVYRLRPSTASACSVCRRRLPTASADDPFDGGVSRWRLSMSVEDVCDGRLSRASVGGCCGWRLLTASVDAEAVCRWGLSTPSADSVCRQRLSIVFVVTAYR